MHLLGHQLLAHKLEVFLQRFIKTWPIFRDKCIRCTFVSFFSPRNQLVQKKFILVEYMPNTLDALRQPVFKGIRDDV